jgi:hypothetical protein
MEAQGYKQVPDWPAHFIHTYNTIPKKTLGMEPGKYGEPYIDGTPNTQETGEKNILAPVWGDRLRKAEEDSWEDLVADWGFETETAAWLAKATEPEHFEAITRALDKNGPQAVDHRGQMNAHPPELNKEVEEYHQHVIAGPAPYNPKGLGRGSGITRKVVYGVWADPQSDMFLPDTRQVTTRRYMVKPYHERVEKRVRKWQKFPIQGWAEMTNQALFHAGGIGHLHQKVHVAEHNMGPGHEQEPALVVHMEPGMKPIYDATVTAQMPGGVGEYDEPIEPTEKAKADVRKIALMDFLANNLDRHGGNLMISRDGNHVLGVDHSRNFQYVNTHQHKWDGQKAALQVPELEEKFHPYFGEQTSSISRVDRYQHPIKSNEDRLRKYEPVFKWWGQVSDKVKAAFHEQLKHIKDEKTRKHLARNFDARAAWLDERAKFDLGNFGLRWMWDPVRQYHPHQVSDAEKEFETKEAVAARGQEEERLRKLHEEEKARWANEDGA